MIEPTILTSDDKILVGMPVTMSLIENKTGALFAAFMPRRDEIAHRLDENVFDLQVYDSSYHKVFNPANEFEKWALVEVTKIDAVPEGMQRFDLSSGLYARFDYQGLGTDPAIYQYIFTQWLPQSTYQLDARPHFDIMGPGYRHDNPQAESEIWIPIRMA